jgi:hypothetical protein
MTTDGALEGAEGRCSKSTMLSAARNARHIGYHMTRCQYVLDYLRYLARIEATPLGLQEILFGRYLNFKTTGERYGSNTRKKGYCIGRRVCFSWAALATLSISAMDHLSSATSVPITGRRNLHQRKAQKGDVMRDDVHFWFRDCCSKQLQLLLLNLNLAGAGSSRLPCCSPISLLALKYLKHPQQHAAHVLTQTH